jgi:hypothetical protein
MLLEDPELYIHLALPQAHELDRQPPGTVPNLQHSRAWRDHVVHGSGRNVNDRCDPNWNTENDMRNLVLSLGIDPFVPWTNQQSYSITPFMLMVLNLPENLRHKHENLILFGVAPGKKKPANLQPYLALLVEELLALYKQETAIEYTNPTTGLKAKSRVKLLFTCADYPGHSDIRNQQCQGARWGCMTCDLKVSHRIAHSAICTARFTR